MHDRAPSHALAPLVLSALLASPAVAGDLIVVDDDGGAGVDFTSLQPAIDAALDGDTIVLRTGTYAAPATFPPVELEIAEKSLSIVADGAPVLVSSLEIRGTSTSQPVTVRGIDLEDAEVLILGAQGPVWLEDVTISGTNFSGPTSTPIEALNSAAVHLIRVEATGIRQVPGSYPGLFATSSNLYVYDSVLTGGGGYGSIATGADGAVLDGGFLFASGSTFQGGDNGCGGNGLRLIGSDSEARTLDCDLQAGPPADCGGGAFGLPVAEGGGTHLPLAGTARSFVASPPLAVGESGVHVFQGEPFDLVLLNLSLEPGGLFLPELGGVLQPGLGSLKVRNFGVLDATGTKVVPITVGPLGIDAVAIYLQATMVSLTPALEVDEIVLSSGSVLLLTSS